VNDYCDQGKCIHGKQTCRNKRSSDDYEVKVSGISVASLSFALVMALGVLYALAA
jgi:hypothetical protein